MGVRSADWRCERHGQSTPCQIRFPRGSKRSSRLRPRPEPCRERTVERHWYLQSSASFCRRVRRHRTRYSQATRLEVQRMRYDLELRLPSLFALTYFYPFLNSLWFPRSQFSFECDSDCRASSASGTTPDGRVARLPGREGG